MVERDGLPRCPSCATKGHLIGHVSVWVAPNFDRVFSVSLGLCVTDRDFNGECAIGLRDHTVRRVCVRMYGGH